MRISRNWSRFAVLLALMALIAAGCAKKATPSATSSKKTGPTIVVGSANFAESQTLAEIYAQALEHNGYTIEKKQNIGNREVYEPALAAGKIGFISDYLNTMLEFLGGKGSASVQDDVTAIGPLLDAKGLVAFDPAPAQNRNEFAVTKATADKYHLTKVSDLAAIGDKLVLGGPPECPTRPLCEKGLEQTYGIHFKSFKSLDVGGPLTVAALKSGKIDVGLLFTTDPTFIVNGFVRLEDDKKLQGADNIVPILRKEIATTYGDGLKTLVNSISAKITSDGLQDLNKKVQVDKQDSADVAREWLQTNGFLS
jgi:osmoprotectant transport system substrate-binding protein